MADPKKRASSEGGDELLSFDSSVGEGKYDASKLGKLEGLEAVRKKPGMYIGGTDERALHHCISEVLDNSIDEHLAGYGKKIEVRVHVDGSISIRDEGRGIPVDIHPQYNIPGVEMVLTTLHSGGKYGQGGYIFSGGTHGVGAKCVNAVSEWFEVEVSRDGKVYHMEFERGKTVKKPSAVRETSMILAWRATASSMALSSTSAKRWCRARSSVPPMYMPGRLRTGSRPSRTSMSLAE